ncbi:nucleotide exchange factor GrpE [Micromonospora sp. WMMD956]|uniref:nucleotide exchange factor GrpE n=1 Tax=Micromonospora TaxID=1873 RepID=UPI002416132C|nr:nucleotide exchange factor GrpE [Micromonospora sp. WMMD956]MDG4818308.1 nucleotide exchange factor GrpE [Micromonospora sp. WMMD956]
MTRAPYDSNDPADGPADGGPDARLTADEQTWPVHEETWSVQEELPDGEPGESAADRLWEIGAALAAIQHELARQNERAAARERVIDRLHEENLRLRSGEYRSVTRPLVTDLQSLRNDLLRQAATLRDPVTVPTVAELLGSFAYSIELTLERAGVQVLRATAGTPFEPGSHRVARVVCTDDPARDGTVAEPLADGYRDVVSDRVLLPASVVVCRRSATPTPVRTPPPAPGGPAAPAH